MLLEAIVAMQRRLDIPSLSSTNFSKLDDSRKADLNKLSIIELKEILERQEKLLSNKKFISSLPDKGKRIGDYRQKVLEKLKSKELVDQTTTILSKLSIGQRVDLSHPMASEPVLNIKPEVHPYAKILGQALDETSPKAKFVPNKSKNKLEEITAGKMTPNALKLNAGKESVQGRISSITIKSEPIDGDHEMQDETHATHQAEKTRTGKIIEKYANTGLTYSSAEKRLHELSVNESLELSKSQIAKEKQVAILRKVERSIKYYEHEDEVLDFGDENDEENDDEQGTQIVIRYI